MTGRERITSRKERRRVIRDERQALQQIERKHRFFRGATGAALLVLAVVGAAYGFMTLQKQYPFDVTQECVTHTRLGLHIHPHLTVRINGVVQNIPANIGIPGHDCMRPVHTHDDSGTLHVEWTSPRDFTLGDFFRIWGQSFSRERILGYATGGGHELVMTVNGRASTEFENLVLRDQDRILIDYRPR